MAAPAIKMERVGEDIVKIETRGVGVKFETPGRSVGDRLSAQDRDGEWYGATIKAIGGTRKRNQGEYCGD